MTSEERDIGVLYCVWVKQTRNRKISGCGSVLRECNCQQYCFSYLKDYKLSKSVCTRAAFCHQIVRLARDNSVMQQMGDLIKIDPVTN